MSRTVKEGAVQLVPIGTSGKNHIITLDKSALMAIREGRSFDLDIIAGDQKMKIVIMRDTEFKKKVKLLNAIDQKAGSAVLSQELEKETADLAEDIGKGVD